jgi:hypothetical protein
MSRDWRDPLPAALATTFWGRLGVRDREILFGAGSVRPLRRGATLCREGQHPGRVWVIYSGRAEVLRHGAAGHRTVLAVRGPGDILGDSSCRPTPLQRWEQSVPAPEMR